MLLMHNICNYNTLNAIYTSIHFWLELVWISKYLISETSLQPPPSFKAFVQCVVLELISWCQDFQKLKQFLFPISRDHGCFWTSLNEPHSAIILFSKAVKDPIFEPRFGSRLQVWTNLSPLDLPLLNSWKGDSVYKELDKIQSKFYSSNFMPVSTNQIMDTLGHIICCTAKHFSLLK